MAKVQAAGQKIKDEHSGRISLHPLTLEQALHGAMQVPPPKKAKPKKRKRVKRKT